MITLISILLGQMRFLRMGQLVYQYYYKEIVLNFDRFKSRTYDTLTWLLINCKRQKLFTRSGYRLKNNKNILSNSFIIKYIFVENRNNDL